LTPNNQTSAQTLSGGTQADCGGSKVALGKLSQGESRSAKKPKKTAKKKTAAKGPVAVPAVALAS
jgi:hypothetical protein